MHYSGGYMECTVVGTVVCMECVVVDTVVCMECVVVGKM